MATKITPQDLIAALREYAREHPFSIEANRTALKWAATVLEREEKALKGGSTVIRFICKKTGRPCSASRSSASGASACACVCGPCDNREVEQDDANEGKYTGLLEEEVT